MRGGQDKNPQKLVSLVLYCLADLISTESGGKAWCLCWASDNEGSHLLHPVNAS